MKKASKVDYFAILHPLVLIILPAMAYLIWHMLKNILFTFLNLLIGKPIVKQDDSFLIVFFYICIAVFILYSVGFLAQLMLHICNGKESTLLPVWCMLTALILLVPTVENGRILSSGWTPYAYFLSIAAYIAYLFSKRPKVREGYRSNAKIRYMDCVNPRHYSGFLVNNSLSTKLLSPQKVIDSLSGNSYNKIAISLWKRKRLC